MKMFFEINRNGVSKVYYIAIDIGGTQIKSAVIDKQLNMFDYQQISTPDNKSELITDKVYEIVTGYMKQYQLIQPVIGISSAGVVDEQKGEIGYAGPTIPNYKGTNFKRLLKSLSPYVKVKNDVNAALLGELKLHQYQAERIFCMTLGTGIGGACTRIIKVILIMVSFIRQMKLGIYCIVQLKIQRLSNVLQRVH